VATSPCVTSPFAGSTRLLRPNHAPIDLDDAAPPSPVTRHPPLCKAYAAPTIASRVAYGLSVCLLVTTVTHKTAEPIEVLFGPRNHGSDGGTDPLWGKGHLLGRILEHTQACPRSTFSTLFAKRHHLATGAVTICYLLLPRSAKMRPIATDVAWSVCVSVCSSRPAGCAVDSEPCYVGT